MDLIYLIFTVGLGSIRLLTYIVSCGRCNFYHEESIIPVYKYFYHMELMDIEHFRHLRTISQLSFESVPQILLQIRILLYTKADELDID